MSDIKYLVTVDAAGAVTQIKNFEGAIGNAEKAAGKATPAHASMFKEIFGGVTAANLATEAIRKMVSIGKDAFTGALDQERADNALRSSLTLTGRTVDENFRHYLDFAKSQQQVTKYRDEEIEGAQALLLQLTNLDQEGLDRATKGTMGLATVMDMDLKSAANMVGRALYNDADAIGRLKINVDASLPPQEKQAAILRELEKLYGRSTAEIEGNVGKVELLKKNAGELEEALGTLALKGFEPYINLVGKAAKVILELLDANDYLTEATNRNAASQKFVIDRMGQAAEKAGMQKKAFEDLVSIHTILTEKGQKLVAEMEFYGKTETEISAALDKTTDAFYVNTRALGQSIEQTQYGTKYLDEYRRTHRDIPAAVNETGNAIKKVADTIKVIETPIVSKSRIEWGAYSRILSDQVAASITVVDTKLDGVGRRFTALEILIPSNKKDMTDWGKTALQAAESVAMSFSQLFGVLSSSSQASFQSQMNDLDAWYSKQKDIISKSTVSEKSKNDQMAALDKDYEGKKTAMKRQAAQSQKSLDIAQAVSGVAAAVISALQTKPFIPLGLIAAAMAVAMGAVQIGVIKSQPIPLAKGGILTRPTFAGGYEAGEAGPEAVIPISPRAAQRASSALAGEYSGRPIHLHNWIELDGKVLATQVVKIIRDESETRPFISARGIR